MLSLLHGIYLPFISHISRSIIFPRSIDCSPDSTSHRFRYIVSFKLSAWSDGFKVIRGSGRGFRGSIQRPRRMELPERAEGLEGRQSACGSEAAAGEGRGDRREGRRSIPRVAINRRRPDGEGREAVRGDRHRKMQRSGVRLCAACWREGGAALAGRRFQLVRAAPCTAARRARNLTPASRHPRMLAVLNRTNLMKRNRVPSSGPR